MITILSITIWFWFYTKILIHALLSLTANIRKILDEGNIGFVLFLFFVFLTHKYQVSSTAEHVAVFIEA